MSDERERIDAFLACNRVALVGASTDEAHFSRAVMRALIQHGLDVVPVHPEADEIHGRRAFAHVTEIDPPVEGALIMTPPSASAAVVEECAAAGIGRLWLHRGAGTGSVSPEAVRCAESHGLELVAGRCPLMFLGERPAFVHRVHAGVERLARSYPERDGRPAPPAPRRWRSTLAYAVGGWLLLATASALAHVAASFEAGVAVHALLAPFLFLGIGFAYQRLAGHLAPAPAAALFAAVVLALDALVLAGAVQRSAAVLTDPLATWAPAAGVLAGAWIGGALARTAPRHAHG